MRGRGRLVAVLLLLVSGCAAPELLTMDPGNAPKSLRVRSEAFADGKPIPAEYTCEGANRSPPLVIEEVPTRAQSLAIVMDDPDAPRGTWLHWAAWNLPPSLTRVAAGVNVSDLGGREGRNDAGDAGYGGPCPPAGKPHRYFVKVYALDATLDVPKGASLKELAQASKGRILAWGETMGTYQR